LRNFLRVRFHFEIPVQGVAKNAHDASLASINPGIITDNSENVKPLSDFVFPMCEAPAGDRISHLATVFSIAQYNRTTCKLWNKYKFICVQITVL